MENSRRITTLSIKLRRICTGLIFCLPILCGLIWIFFNRLYAILGPMMHLPVHVSHDLTGLIRLLAFLADLIPLGAMIYGLQKLRSLFFLYENGLIFTEHNVSCFHCLGRTLIVWAACDVVRTTLLSVILTLDNPPGQRIIAVVFDSGDFTGVFVGGVVLIISWVMDEGRKIQEDQSLIV